MGNIIAFIAGCGGAGKTTAAINIAALLALSGKRVLLVDGAAGLPDLDASLGLERSVRYTVDDVISGRCAASEALIQVPRAFGVWLLAAGPTTGEAGHRSALGTVCRNLACDFDYVIIDAPPGNESGLLAAATAATGHVVVAQHTVQHRRGVEALLGRLREYSLVNDHPWILFNRVTPARAAAAGVSQADLLMGWGLEDEDVIGSIPEDEAAISAKHNGTPLVLAAPGSAAAKAYATALRALLERLPGTADDEPAESEAEQVS